MAAQKRFVITDRRRSARISGYLPVDLVLRNGTRGAIFAGPSRGAIVNVSLHGAGLAVSQIRLDTYHLFYSPQDNPDHVLHIELEGAEEEGREALSIPVRPVRFDRLIENEADPTPFELGVEFLLDAGDQAVLSLTELVAGTHKKKSGWWRTLLDKVLLPAGTDSDRREAE